MSYKKIVTKIDELRMIVSSWSSDAKPASLEMDMALDRVKSIYEMLRFPVEEAEVEEECVATNVEEEHMIAPAQLVEGIVEEEYIVTGEVDSDVMSPTEVFTAESEATEVVEPEVETVVEEEVNVAVPEQFVGGIMEEEYIVTGEVDSDGEYSVEAVEEEAVADEDMVDSGDMYIELVNLSPIIDPILSTESVEVEPVEVEPAEVEPVEEKLADIESVDIEQEHKRNRLNRILSLYEDGDVGVDDDDTIEPKSEFEVAVPEEESDEEESEEEEIASIPVPLSVVRPVVEFHKAQSVENPLEDLLSFNDRLLLTYELFSGNESQLIETLQVLDTQPTLDDAMIYIAENYSWSGDNDGAQLLMSLLQNHYQS